MTKTELLKKLKSLKSCEGALSWVESTTGSPKDLWKKCERSDWLLWVAWRTAVDRKKAVLAACDIARSVLKYVPDGELRPLKAIEAAEGWCKGTVSIEEVHAAANAANASASASATYAAYASADAAYSVYADAYYAANDAANDAARAAYADAAASAAANDAARAAQRDLNCRLIRKHIKFSDIVKGMNK